MKCKVFIATSVDGFIAKKDGNIEWLNEVPNPEGIDYGYSDFMKNIDAVVMGRNTYEKVLSFNQWPYDKPVFVLSQTLKSNEIKFPSKVEVLDKDVKDVVWELSSRGYKTLYIDGGITIQSFLKEDLIDEMIITKIPILLGEGIPLFGHTGKEGAFELVESKSFVSGIVQNRYKRKSVKS